MKFRKKPVTVETIQFTEAMIRGEESSPASLVGTVPIICEGCGKEINPDYGKCLRCG